MTISSGMGSKDIWQQIRRQHDSLLQVNYGIQYLDDALLGMFPGETTLVGARTGGGKTEFATQVLLAQQGDSEKAKSVLYFALDHEFGEIEKRLLWRLIVSRVRAEKPRRLEGPYLRYAEWRAGRYLELFSEYEEEYGLHLKHMFSHSETQFLYKRGELTANEIAKIISRSTFEFNLYILDHFHALRFEGDRFESQRRAIRMLCDASEKANRPLLIMGQFKKRSPGNKAPIPDIEEFSGHSDLLYIPQNIIVFGPNAKEGLDRWETYFHVAKARIAADTKAFVGVHSFDVEAKTYSPKYTVKRFMQFSEPADLKPLEIPFWAKNAIRPSAYENGKLSPMPSKGYSDCNK